MTQQRLGPRRALALGLATSLLVATPGCTNGSDDPGSRSPVPEGSVGSAPTLEPKPVPLKVNVVRVVGGRLKEPGRRRIEQPAGKVVEAYLEAAYLGGEYPRRRFRDAFAYFTPGAAVQARRDRALLTNAGAGAATEAVVTRANSARLDVLLYKDRVVGLTARLFVEFVQERIDAPDVRVRVRGRLMLQRAGRSYRIFGYDINRSTRQIGKGTS